MIIEESYRLSMDVGDLRRDFDRGMLDPPDIILDGLIGREATK